MAKTNKNDVTLTTGITFDAKALQDLKSGFDKINNIFKSATQQMEKTITSFNKTINMSLGNDTGNDTGLTEFDKLTSDLQKAQDKLNELEETKQQYMTKYSNPKDSAKLNEALMATDKAITRQQRTILKAETALNKYNTSQKNIANTSATSSDTINKSNKKIEESNENLANSYELVDYAAVGFFRRIMNTGIKIFTSLTTAGSDYSEINSRFARILGDYAGMAEENAERIANAFGRNLTETKNDLATIYTLLKNSNLETETAIMMSSNLVAIANELASMWDTDVNQAINAVISGLQGLPKAMKLFGVYVTESEVEEYLKEAGLLAEDFTGQLDSGQKAMGTYLKILDDAGFAIKDFATTQNSVANQLRIAQSSITALKQNLGNMMNTVLSPVLVIINKGLKVINLLTNQLDNLPQPLKVIVGIMTTFIVSLPILIGFTLLAKRALAIYKKQLDRLAESTAAATGATTLLNKALLWTGKNIGKIVFWGTVLLVLISSIASLFKQSSEEMSDANEEIDKTYDAASDLKRMLASFDDVNVASFSDKSQDEEGINWAGFTDIDSLSEGFDKLVENMTGISEITQDFEDLNKIILIVASSMVVAKTIALIFSKSLKLTKLQVVGLTTTIAAVIAAIMDIVNVWNSEEPTWYKIVRTIFDVVFAIGALSMAISILTKNWAGLARSTAVMAIGASGMTAAQFINDKTKTQPQLATGGVATRTVNATIGEGKYAEAVIPLGASPQFADMKSDIANAVVQGLNGANINNNQPINITINVDEDYIYRTYNKKAKLYGRSL